MTEQEKEAFIKDLEEVVSSALLDTDHVEQLPWFVSSILTPEDEYNDSNSD